MSEVEIIKIIASIAALLIAVIGHEIMHGLSALYYGDTTAKIEDRLSLNPIKHIDLVGSILVPLVLLLIQSPFLIGWAKPVPVDIRTVIRHGGYVGAIMVSLAGIIFNLLFAVIVATLLKTGVIPFRENIFSFFAYAFLINLVMINIVLAVFNLLPIPPLDGSQALGYLSLRFRINYIVVFLNKIEPFGMLIIVAILLIPSGFNVVFLSVNFLINLLFRGGVK